jgi:hypothetical protein
VGIPLVLVLEAKVHSLILPLPFLVEAKRHTIMFCAIVHIKPALEDAADCLLSGEPMGLCCTRDWKPMLRGLGQ